MASTRTGAAPLSARLRIPSAGRLARRAAGGDQAAFEEIFRRYHQELYRYCLAIVHSRDDAQDAVQATMTAALRSLPGEEREINLRPWLYRVAHNESISVLRGRGPAADPERAMEATSLPPETELADRDRLRELVADLQVLPERQRSAIVMRELNDLSYAEIGSALSCSEPSARQTVYEARQGLQGLAEGRAMECESVRESISAGDRRRLRGRAIRSHLRSCDGCLAFEAAIERRRTDLRALCPTLPALAAAGMLSGLLGGTSGGGAAGVAAAGGAGATAAGAGLAGSLAAKGAAVAAAVIVAAGAADVGGLIDVPGPIDGDRESEVQAQAPDSASEDAVLPAIATGSPGAAGSADGTGAGSSAGEPGKSGPAPGQSGTSPGRSDEAPGQAGEGPGKSENAPGQTGESPGQSESAPGHGGSSPGKSESAPGQTGSPGKSESAPGQTGSPGKSESAPGQTGTAGSSGSAAGQTGITGKPDSAPPSPPGQSVAPSAPASPEPPGPPPGAGGPKPK